MRLLELSSAEQQVLVRSQSQRVSPYGLQIRVDSVRGRCLVAARTLNPGELVLEEVPYVRGLLPQWKGVRCDWCFERPASTSAPATLDEVTTKSRKLHRCSACHYESYCSKACQAAAWRSHHKYECKAVVGLLAVCHAEPEPGKPGARLPNMPSSSAGPSVGVTPGQLSSLLIATRALNRCMVEMACAGVSTDRDSKGVSSISNDSGGRSGPLHSTWEDVAGMGMQWGDLKGAEPKMKIGIDEMQAGSLAVTHKLLVLPSASSLRVTSDDVARLMATGKRNNFCIADGLLVGVGAGMYPHGALLNHSCSPNCVVSYEYKDGTWLQQIHVVRRVEEGEELTHAYVDIADPTVERQRALQATYQFKCACAECKNQWAQRDVMLEGDVRGRKVAGSTKDVVMQAAQLEEQALLADDLGEERRLLAAQLKALASVLMPTHGLVQTAHRQCLHAAMLAGDWAAAVTHARAVVTIDRTVYTIPHPRAAMDMLTLANLLVESSKVAQPDNTKSPDRHSLLGDAKQAALMAKQHFVIVAGKTSSMVRTINQLLENIASAT